MSFPRYPKYKPSGVEWLGDVPVGWEVKPLRYVCHCLDGSRVPLNSAQRAEKQGNVPYWGANSIMDYVDEALFDEDLVLLGEDGAPFFDKLKPIAFFSSGRVWPNNHVHVLRPAFRETAKFITHALNVTDFAHFVDGSTRDKLTQGAMKEIPLPFPPLAEQTAIAEFLDRETGKIDELVAEQRRLMELLKEKRQAVISHAVTQGLNPHAPMKPSGIEWLGDVPEHWKVLPLNRLVQAGRRITYGIVQPGPRDENGRFMVRGQDYSFGWAEPETLFRVSDEVEIPYRRARLVAGDLVITIVGAGVGNVAVVPSWLDGANITQTTARISVDPAKADPRFVSAVLKGPIGRRSVELYVKGAAQPGLNLEHVRIFPITVPPLSEQREIADFIEGETTKFDTLTAEAQRAIDLLQERRTALISAAVTGQIDVRNHSRKP